MFNIQPGQGLGFTGSKQIAFGLGTFLIAAIIVVSGQRKYQFMSDDLEMQAALKDDKDFLELIIIMAEAGIFD
ncbi:MAG: hypothetical protein JRI94_00365 [Deltaproteobacteria bacterium]|nr:hypothetical protein [Deltaproteobacteria bacterium]